MRRATWLAAACAVLGVAVTIASPPSPRALADRVIVLGFDGMDAGLVSRWMADGQLPNLAALADMDGAKRFRKLVPTTPPESPVSWAAMVTGLNPGRTGVLGFVRRDPESYRLENGLIDIRPGLHLTRDIPLTPTRLLNRRRGEAFWETAADFGVPSVAITVPVSFPSHRRENLRELAGLGVGDLLGTQGTFQLFTTRPDEVPLGGESLFGGRVRHIVPDATGVLQMKLDGPTIPRKASERDRSAVIPGVRMTLSFLGEGYARLQVQQRGAQPLSVDLVEGQWSDLTRIGFRIAGIVHVSGLVRMLLLRATFVDDRPDVALYVTPTQIDPAAPIIALTQPKEWSIALSEKYGPFKTSGISSEVWARSEDYISDAVYLSDLEDTHASWERLVLDELASTDWRLLVAVTQLTDQLGHLFASRDEDVLLRFYQRVDRFVGQVVRDHAADGRTLVLVVSDHGMAEFSRAVNLNRWLQQAGLLTLNEGRDEVRRVIGDFYAHCLVMSGIDWAKTQAYAAGLGGIYVNLRGRERFGIVSAGEQYEGVLAAIRDGLKQLRDPGTGRRVVEEVYEGRRLYRGPSLAETPDLVVGMARGYRVSWETSLAGVSGPVIDDNPYTWSADHCSVDPGVVPGVLLSNWRLATDRANVEDVAATVLDALGIPPAQPMDGSSLLVQRGGVAERIASAPAQQEQSRMSGRQSRRWPR